MRRVQKSEINSIPSWHARPIGAKDIRNDTNSRHVCVCFFFLLLSRFPFCVMLHAHAATHRTHQIGWSVQHPAHAAIGAE